MQRLLAQLAQRGARVITHMQHLFVGQCGGGWCDQPDNQEGAAGCGNVAQLRMHTAPCLYAARTSKAFAIAAGEGGSPQAAQPLPTRGMPSSKYTSSGSSWPCRVCRPATAACTRITLLRRGGAGHRAVNGTSRVSCKASNRPLPGWVEAFSSTDSPQGRHLPVLATSLHPTPHRMTSMVASGCTMKSPVPQL